MRLLETISEKNVCGVLSVPLTSPPSSTFHTRSLAWNEDEDPEQQGIPLSLLGSEQFRMTQKAALVSGLPAFHIFEGL